MASTTHAKIVKLLNKNHWWLLLFFAKKDININRNSEKQQLKHTTKSVSRSFRFMKKKKKVSNVQKFCGDHYNMYIKS